MVDAAIQQDDRETIFPSGCYAHIPDCWFYAGGRLFQCVFTSGSYEWGELL